MLHRCSTPLISPNHKQLSMPDRGAAFLAVRIPVRSVFCEGYLLIFVQISKHANGSSGLFYFKFYQKILGDTPSATSCPPESAVPPLIEVPLKTTVCRDCRLGTSKKWGCEIYRALPPARHPHFVPVACIISLRFRHGGKK